MAGTSRHNGGMRSISAAFRMTEPTDARAMEWMTMHHALRWGGLLPIPASRPQAPGRLACPGLFGSRRGRSGAAPKRLDSGLEGCFQWGTGGTAAGVDPQIGHLPFLQVTPCGQAGWSGWCASMIYETPSAVSNAPAGPRPASVG